MTIVRESRPRVVVPIVETGDALYEFELTAAPSRVWRAAFLRPPARLTGVRSTPDVGRVQLQGATVHFRAAPKRVTPWCGEESQGEGGPRARSRASLMVPSHRLGGRNGSRSRRTRLIAPRPYRAGLMDARWGWYSTPLGTIASLGGDIPRESRPCRVEKLFRPHLPSEPPTLWGWAGVFVADHGRWLFERNGQAHTLAPILCDGEGAQR
jgi:hypothetical protein